MNKGRAGRAELLMITRRVLRQYLEEARVGAHQDYREGGGLTLISQRCIKVRDRVVLTAMSI